jgi:predicted unusual protein kinase regulating ubiquinone biosynthesis (AarF/ABC1/UbiB family)
MSTRFSRLSKLGALTTRVSTSYLGHAVAGLFQDEQARKDSTDKLHRENAERIVKDLGSLKGAAMKVGQAVAQLSDSLDLPPDVRLVLGKLHDRVEPVPFTQVQARVEAELGGSLSDLFKRFDPEPVGTASLGQAHSACLPDGTEVIVKVLHTGIDSSVHADLSALKTMLVAGRFLRRPKEEIDAIFEEIEERLKEELDYQLEAQNLQEFRRYFINDPELSGEVRVPLAHLGWSTKTVLTMERLPGRPLTVFAASAPESSKQRAGITLAKAQLTMQYLHRAIHADPHPGNYLFTPDGKLGILDFGCVRRFDLQWMAGYGGCGLATRVNDRKGCMQSALKIGALTQRDPVSEDALWALCRAIGRPFRDGEFSFDPISDDVQEQIAAAMPKIMLAPCLRSPRELVFLHRSLAGLHQILRILKPRADWGQLFEERARICQRDADRALQPI